MKILVLAPQPFFQERGTPIAVRMLLKVLVEKYIGSGGTGQIELLTYHEGSPTTIEGIKQHRIRAPGWLKGIKPGISLKKLIADWFFLCKTLSLTWSNRKDQFTLIHAIEESVFIAWLCKKLFGIPYVYDMDSSLSLQLTESWKPLRMLLPIFEKLESVAIADSLAVIPVCDALAETARAQGAKNVCLLTDVSTIKVVKNASTELRQELGIPEADVLFLYVGNLAHYQGVELLVESFLKLTQTGEQQAHLAIVGGNLKEVHRFEKLKQGSRFIHLLGARPLSQLPELLAQADVLVSPRIEGNNTPMKIYNYMASGKAILATDIRSHTQVLSREIAVLCSPDADSMTEALVTLVSDAEMRATLGKAAAQLASTQYTEENFRKTVIDIYNSIERAS